MASEVDKAAFTFAYSHFHKQLNLLGMWASPDWLITNMYYVYILRSVYNENKFYIGYTGNLDRRLSQHKDAPTDSYTHRYAPRHVET
jgi:hypothetical protein